MSKSIEEYGKSREEIGKKAGRQEILMSFAESFEGTTEECRDELIQKGHATPEEAEHVLSLIKKVENI